MVDYIGNLTLSCRTLVGNELKSPFQKFHLPLCTACHQVHGSQRTQIYMTLRQKPICSGTLGTKFELRVQRAAKEQTSMSGTHYPKCEVCYYFNFHSCALFGNKVATHNIANVFQSGDDCEDSGTSRKEEVGDECGLGPLMSFAKAPCYFWNC